MTLAPPPFDDLEGDVILWSSDNVDFRFFKLFLSKASEVFSSMFQVPPPPMTSPSDHIDGVPVMRVSENSQLLEQLLRFCHPALQSPSLSSADQVLSFHIVMEKYNIPEAMAWSRVGLNALMDGQTTSVLVVSYHLGWREEANAAAKRLLRVPLDDLMNNTGAEMGRVSAKSLQLFSAYRKGCIQQASAVCYSPSENSDLWKLQGQSDNSQDNLWEELFPDCPNCDCSEPDGYEESYPFLCPKSWVVTYLGDVRRALKARPSEEVVHDPVIVAKAITEARRCKGCAPTALGMLQSFLPLLSKCVRNAIDSVELEF